MKHGTLIGILTTLIIVMCVLNIFVIPVSYKLAGTLFHIVLVFVQLLLCKSSINASRGKQ